MQEGTKINTFLPYSSFAGSACVLDNKRLGKQRIEVLQILRVLAGVSSGWKNHPAVRMWRGHGASLAIYGREMCREWKKRGYRDATGAKILEISLLFEHDGEFSDPPWLGNKEFHLSHQSNLVRKNPDHYRRYFPHVPDDLPYVWPV